MTSVTVRGISLPPGPGRCSQWTLSLMCTLLTSSNTSVRSCKPHSCNNRQCLSFTWLPQTSLASVSTASYQEAISPRACSLGQDFFPKHPRLPFPTKGYTCYHPWNTSDPPSEGNAVPKWLAGGYELFQLSQDHVNHCNPKFPIFWALTEALHVVPVKPLSLCIQFRSSSHPQLQCQVERGARRGTLYYSSSPKKSFPHKNPAFTF